MDEPCPQPIRFYSASITNHVFDSGRSVFRFAILDQLLILTITDARITGTVVNQAGETGFALKNGVLTGYILKSDLDYALLVALDRCDSKDNPSNACSYLTLIPTMFTYDLDMNDDDEPDAVSLCITFDSVKARIIGYIPE